MELKERKRFDMIDGCFVSSPIAQKFTEEAGMKTHYINRQIYNERTKDRFKIHNDKVKNLTIFWTGVGLNLVQNKMVEPVLRKICQRHSSEVVYLTDVGNREDGCIKYRLWDINTWEDKIIEGDIAFRWWEPSNDQYHKDPNKSISYMAAGLPLVCKPTASDRMVIEDGKTGLFAESLQDFEKCIEILILNPKLRKEIGQAAHQEVWRKYSLEQHVNEIKTVIEGYVNHGDRH